VRGGNAAGRERRSSDARFAQSDSALSQIGLHRLSVAEFERRLQILQAFLRGEEVQLPNRTSSSIRWLHDSAQPKVPVHVAATGRRTIAVGTRHAEGVDLTVGAELERLRLGVATVRQAGPPGRTVGAYINVAVDPDRDRAPELVCGSVATFARFSSQAGSASRLSESTSHAAAQTAAGYQPARHGEAVRQSPNSCKTTSSTDSRSPDPRATSAAAGRRSAPAASSA
jgi:hypothetical protein